MTHDDNSPRRPRSSLAVQIVGLLILGVVLAQAVTAVLILVLPPPRPPLYRLSDVASALQGGSLQASTGWRLVRSQSKAPPQDDPRDKRARDSLAVMLNAAPARVRLVRHHGRPAWARVVSIMFRNGPGPPLRQDGPPEFGEGPGLRSSTANAMAARPWNASFERGRAGWREAGCGPGASACGDPLLFQDFSAAYQQADGAWVLVRPPPERFPNDWQRRILLWLGISIALVVPMGYLFARRITAPLGAFARAADRFGKDPASPLMVLDGPAEIGVAARA
ncbi:MAG: HAMP domain-containing protein, partial [Caulobacteraceae bacterium]